MSYDPVVSTVFWPVDATDATCGYLVGWNVKGFVACVATVIPAQEAALAHVEQAIRSIADDGDLAALQTYCGGPPAVLGLWTCQQRRAPMCHLADNRVELAAVSERKLTNSIWLSVEATQNAPNADMRLVPWLRSIHCVGVPWRTRSHIVFYTPPDSSSQHYYMLPVGHSAKATHLTVVANTNTSTSFGMSINQINCALYLRAILKQRIAACQNGSIAALAIRPRVESRESVSSAPEVDADNQSDASEAVSDDDNDSDVPVTPPASNPADAEPAESKSFFGGDAADSGPVTIDSPSRPAALRRRYRTSSSRSSGAQSELATPSTTSAGGAGTASSDNTVQPVIPGSKSRLFPILRLLFSPIWWLIATCMRGILWVLSVKVPGWLPVLGGFTVREQMWVLRQMDHRVREILTWPDRLAVALHPQGWQQPRDVVAFRSRLYSSMFLVLFDVLLGCSCFAALALSAENRLMVLRWLHTGGQILHVEVMKDQVEWLMGLPAGLKLNSPLDFFLGSGVLTAIDAWNAITTFLTPLEPVIVVAVGTAGFFGFTFVVALAADALNMTTVHVYTIYRAFAKLHNVQASLLSSLWLLFRGKKHNVLRNRVDSADFNVSQLLVGTLLFTVLFFLFPTSLVYYVFFTLVWLMILTVQAFLWWVLSGLNHFPFYGILVHVWCPSRLPAGVRLTVLSPATTLRPIEPPTAISRMNSGGSGDDNTSPPPALTRTLSLPVAAAADIPRVKPTPLGSAAALLASRSSAGFPPHTRSRSGGQVPLEGPAWGASSAPSSTVATPTMTRPTSPDPDGDMDIIVPAPTRVVPGPRPPLSRLRVVETADRDANAGSMTPRSHPTEAPYRLPGTTYFRLHSLTASVGSLFHTYSHLMGKLSGHYTPKKLLRTLFLGVFIPSSNAGFAGHNDAQQLLQQQQQQPQPAA